MKQYVLSPEHLANLRLSSRLACRMSIRQVDGNAVVTNAAPVELLRLGTHDLCFRSALLLPPTRRIGLQFQLVIDDTILTMEGELRSRNHTVSAGEYDYVASLEMQEQARSMLYFSLNKWFEETDPFMSKVMDTYGAFDPYHHCCPRINFQT